MSTKHTPGPWRSGRNGGSVVCGSPVPDVGGSDHVEYYGGHLIAESISARNVPVIAVAPELLEVAQLIAAFNFNSDVPLGEIQAKARAAIAKATGEQQ